MIFGLSNAQAAATLAAVLIGHEIIMENGERLLNDDVLNGTVVMILFTCVISSLVTERSARRFAMNEELQSEEQGAKKSTEQILIPVANPDTIEDLINLALVIKDAKQFGEERTARKAKFGKSGNDCRCCRCSCKYGQPL